VDERRESEGRKKRGNRKKEEKPPSVSTNRLWVHCEKANEGTIRIGGETEREKGKRSPVFGEKFELEGRKGKRSPVFGEKQHYEYKCT